MQVIISEYIDKIENFCSLSKLEQIKYMAYIYTKSTNDSIFTQKNIDRYFELAHLPKPSNIPLCFGNLVRNEIFIPFKNGYILHRNVAQELDIKFSENTIKKKTSDTLRSLLIKINNENEKQFLKEAISCYEIQSYRATIIMIWILAIDHMYEYIFNNNKRLSEFNKILSNQNFKIKTISDRDDFIELKESKFIEICRFANIITTDTKKIMDEKLGIRNSCAHPNDMLVKESKATNFIEDLVENVILKYNP